MRQITTMSDERLAQRFADYLLTQSIRTQLLDEDEQRIAVWVEDEDKVAQARQELEEFLKAPGDPRYEKAASQAQSIRKREAKQESDYQDRQRRFAEVMANAGLGERPLITISLIAVSIVVALFTNFGSKQHSSLQQALQIQSVVWVNLDQYFKPQGLTDVASGQVWRLITPIFLHFDFLHLLFNSLMTYSLGGAVETSRGRLKFLLIVLLLAATSNAAEFYVSISFAKSPWISFDHSVFFGGLSGVVYGLFGYVWMKSRFEPELGLTMPQQTVLILMGWLVLCMFGVLGPIANTAHGVGLLVGMAIALAPQAWKR